MGRGESAGVLEVESVSPRSARAGAQPPALGEPGGPEITERERDELYKSGWAYTPPTRRSLEAALALAHNVPVEDFKLANRDRSWGELWREAEELPSKLGLSDRERWLMTLALEAEKRFKRDDGRSVPPPDNPAQPDSREPHWWFSKEERRRFLDEEFERLGPGARSGRIEDYSRPELRKLLGFLERECKHLSDEDLRGMALDGRLVPRLRSAPSHADLAAARAQMMSGGPFTKRDAFREGMRMSYGDLARETGLNDDPMLDQRLILGRLSERHPFFAPLFSESRHHDLDCIIKVAERSGIETELPLSEQNTVAEGAIRELMTPLELSYKEAFDDFAEQFGGARKLGRIRESLTDRYGRRTRGCVAYYSPETGDINLSSAYAKILRAKDPSPSEIETAVSTMAHELFHAIEGRDEGSKRTGSRNKGKAEHALDEGATEALAQIYTQDLAQRMGLWDDSKGDLREHASGGSYAGEVETTIALAALCSGELDREKLREGAYARPEALSDTAKDWLLRIHVENGPRERLDLITQTLSANPGWKGGDSDDSSAVCDLLKLSKFRPGQWRRVIKTNEDGKRELSYERDEEKPLGERISDWLGEVGL